MHSTSRRAESARWGASHKASLYVLKMFKRFLIFGVEQGRHTMSDGWSERRFTIALLLLALGQQFTCMLWISLQTTEENVIVCMFSCHTVPWGDMSSNTTRHKLFSQDPLSSTFLFRDEIYMGSEIVNLQWDTSHYLLYYRIAASASFLADISVSSPRKIYFSLSKKIFSGSKYPKNSLFNL